MMGGYGYSSEYDMERLVRTSLVSTIYGGTSEIQRNIIAKTARPLSHPRQASTGALSFAQPRAFGPGFFSCNGRPYGTRENMARGDVRIAVTLACEDCKRRNYQTNKSRRNSPDRIELRKFCRWCGHHTAHKETR